MEKQLGGQNELSRIEPEDSAAASPSAELTKKDELVQLAAADPELFEKLFFSNSIRMENAPFHSEVWKILESSQRLVSILMFRGSGKTTKLRMYLARRIAYGLSRTIMYVGISQDKAVQSTRWMRRQIEFNREYSTFFGLTPGAKWQDTEFEITHSLLQHRITVLAYGVTGSIRGVNIDDYRPDLIILDDIINEENSATDEQRKKIHNLVYGALINSLAPATESADAKVVMLQTPQHREDVAMRAQLDPAWLSLRQGCWTVETEAEPPHRRESAWPVRFPSETLRRQREFAVNRNDSFTWNREYECRLTSPETSAFNPTWLQTYSLAPERPQMQIAIGLDPVPPPTDDQIAKGNRKKDYEVFCVIGAWQERLYLLDYAMNRGHEPDWTIKTFFELGRKWNPQMFVVEVVAYQKTLEWILRKAMIAARTYHVIHPFTDARSKYDRILDSYKRIASNGQLYVHESHAEFRSDFSDYPDVSHDDLLDAGSMAIMQLEPFMQNAILAGTPGEDPDKPLDQSKYTDFSRPLTFSYPAP